VARCAPVQAGPRGPRLALAALAGLPPELHPWALAELNARAGLPYPPRRAAMAELARQLRGGGAVACDCAAGWRWAAREGYLELDAPAIPEPSMPRVAAADAPPRPTAGPGAPRRAASAGGVPFAYTLAAPGGVEIREAATIFRLTRQPVAPWMRQGSATRAALDLPLATGGLVTVRNRRPGDRLQPLGCAFERRLKDVLIDRKVPRHERDRLPLLCCDEQVVWVPGVTVHHAYRLRSDARMAWVAELLPAAARQEEMVR
jgi:tRNA(Ile)-lysidine synthetase-like protein